MSRVKKSKNKSFSGDICKKGYRSFHQEKERYPKNIAQRLYQNFISGSMSVNSMSVISVSRLALAAEGAA